jgi:hypothetical protein
MTAAAKNYMNWLITLKSDSMTTKMTTTTIDKLFADGGASMKAMRFLEIWGR